MSDLVVIENESAPVPVKQDMQPMRLIELAINNNADIDKLERLMAMQQQWDARNAKRDYLEALARFQRLCPTIKKLKTAHNSKYAPLADIVAQTKELIADCGLSYWFEQDHSKGIEVTCVISHSSGHSERVTMTAESDKSGNKNAIQAVASTVTYLMRYTFIGGLGITTADEDIDGRLPEKEEPVNRKDLVASVIDLLIGMDKSESEFFNWWSRASKRKEPLASFEDMSDKELLMAKAKLGATK
ncbi:MAG: ERF family protein [Aeromonas veronii]